jgi:hypothetical protein
MEYFIGSITTLIAFLTIRFFVFNNKTINQRVAVKFSQSYVFELIGPFYPDMNSNNKTKKSQSINHYKKNHVMVLFLKDQAYWIKDNKFYTADIVDGFVDQDSTRIVDIMGMDKIQLEEMSFIVEALTEGQQDDSGSTRNS